MTSPDPSVHRSAELIEMIEKIILQANEPMDTQQVVMALPVSFRKNENAIRYELEQMALGGRVFTWKPRARSRGKRYWKTSDAAFCKQLILSEINVKPLTKPEILQKSRSRLFSMTTKAIIPLIQSGLKELIAEGSLFVHPPRQIRHRVRYASVPVDPALYIAKLRTEFGRVMKLLQHSGTTAQDILRRLGEDIPPAAVPGGKPGNEPPLTKEDMEIPLPELAETLLHTIHNRIPGAKNRVPIWLPELRSYSRLSKTQFDRAVLHLARTGKLHLDRHTHPGSLNEETRKPFVQDEEGVSYVAAVLL